MRCVCLSSTPGKFTASQPLGPPAARLLVWVASRSNFLASLLQTRPTKAEWGEALLPESGNGLTSDRAGDRGWVLGRPTATVVAGGGCGHTVAGAHRPSPARGRRTPPPRRTRFQMLGSSRALEITCMEPPCMGVSAGISKTYLHPPGSDSSHRGTLPATVHQKWPS